MSAERRWMLCSDDVTATPHVQDRSCADIGCRPVVLIDPEDREQVERLAKALSGSLDFRDGSLLAEAVSAALADTLQTLIEPPKPPEPLGLGAVVEDDRGVRWVRTDMCRGVTSSSWSSEAGSQNYAEIDVVKKLSDGVS